MKKVLKLSFSKGTEESSFRAGASLDSSSKARAEKSGLHRLKLKPRGQDTLGQFPEA